MNPYFAYISMKAASDFSDALDLYVVAHDAPLSEHMRAQNRGYIPLHMLKDKGRDSHLVYVHRMSYNPAMHLKSADPARFHAMVRTHLGGAPAVVPAAPAALPPPPGVGVAPGGSTAVAAPGMPVRPPAPGAPPPPGVGG
jgi:hypothetical protein